MIEDLNQEAAADRFEQIMNLLHAARIPSDINSAVVLWQIGISTMCHEGMTEEKITEWLAEWFRNKRIYEANSKKVDSDLTEFLDSIIKHQEEETKEP